MMSPHTAYHYQILAFSVILLLITSSCRGQSEEESTMHSRAQDNGLQHCWEQVSQHLNQASISEAGHLAPNHAWQTLLMIDVTYWTAYTWEEELVSQNKAIARIQFHEVSKPVVLTFCRINGKWRFQGLYLYRMPWAYLIDPWETLLDKGKWAERVSCK